VSGGAPAGWRVVAMPSSCRAHAVAPTLGGMWTHRTQRHVDRPASEVRGDVARLVALTWGRAGMVTTTEHHGRRSDWISSATDPDDLDVVLTWTLVDLDGATFVTLELDEMDRGPDPIGQLEAMLDVVSVARAVR
jgi:hypothetical protein